MGPLTSRMRIASSLGRLEEGPLKTPRGWDWGSQGASTSAAVEYTAWVPTTGEGLRRVDVAASTRGREGPDLRSEGKILYRDK